ncbi:MAG: Biopolymer transport protein ExbD/TolR [Verrucomicrobiales bacterium]|jgi:biopolymer transport protein ExbD|nr:Biopolymer transport protein ExbD/TolR [Verrucomicrobiales bacterium]MDB6130712.1 Biopolymer transport protein ExbD/TolR [Verrucomicrobiales bacterium]
MRRFSQRNHLVTLNEINITPLLDLAFVLLVIFIITRPLIEQSIDLKLPKGGNAVGKADARDSQTVEITPQGAYKLNGRPATLDQVVNQLDAICKSNPKAFVSVRADENSPYKYMATLMDKCQKKGINRFAWKTFPDK